MSLHFVGFDWRDPANPAKLLFAILNLKNACRDRRIIIYGKDYTPINELLSRNVTHISSDVENLTLNQIKNLMSSMLTRDCKLITFYDSHNLQLLCKETGAEYLSIETTQSIANFHALNATVPDFFEKPNILTELALYALSVYDLEPASVHLQIIGGMVNQAVDPPAVVPPFNNSDLEKWGNIKYSSDVPGFATLSDSRNPGFIFVENNSSVDSVDISSGAPNTLECDIITRYECLQLSNLIDCEIFAVRVPSDKTGFGVLLVPANPNDQILWAGLIISGNSRFEYVQALQIYSQVTGDIESIKKQFVIRWI